MASDPGPDGATRLMVGGGGSIAPGTLLCNGTYRVEERLGAGGMGEVYRGINTVTGSACAIKTIRPELVADEFLRGLFAREAEALKSIRDGAVVGYEGVFRDEDGRLLIVMEYVDGPSLGARMRERALSVDETTRLARRLARGLAAAHARGVHHRDLSPDNVLFPGGRLEEAVIIDFGIARREGGDGPTLFGAGSRGGFAGKLAYASPEQIGAVDAPVDHRSDVYSLGLVLAAGARGRPLPMGEDVASATAARRQAPDLSSLPLALRGLLAPLLTPRPEDRLRNLEGFPPPEVAAIAKDAAADRSKGGGRSGLGWLPWAGGGAVAMALAGAAFVLLTEPPPPPPLPPPIETTDTQPPVTTPPSTTTTVEPTTTTAPATTLTDRARIEQELRKFLAGVPCAGGLNAALGDDGVVYLSGTVASEAARDGLASRAGVVAGVVRVESGLGLAPAPHCEGAERIAGLAGGEAGGAALPPPVIELSQPDGVYNAARDVFEAVLSLPGGPPAYLYLDYFHETGDVYHLLPEELAPDNILPAGATLRVGRPPEEAEPGDRVWRLSEPFGAGRVVAIASAEPLYEGLRQIDEKAADYLAFLEQALPPARERGLSTASVAIETRAGP